MAEKGVKRKLTAILSADEVEYSRLMGEDEKATVRTITTYREVLTTLIQQHNGKVLDSPGDNLLAEFVSVVDAGQGAVAVQKEIKARNDELPENRRLQFRIGINLGDVIPDIVKKLKKRSFFWTIYNGESPTSILSHFLVGVCAAREVNFRQSSS